MSETDDYLDARSAYDHCNTELNAMRDIVRRAGQALDSNRGMLIFANSGIGLPSPVALSSQAVSIDANRWPSAEKIMEALVRWHEARSKMTSAWSTVPEARRAGLQQPPR
jgi:hypothetical protein